METGNLENETGNIVFSKLNPRNWKKDTHIDPLKNLLNIDLRTIQEFFKNPLTKV